MEAQLIDPEELHEGNHLETSRTILRVVHNLADRSSTRLMETMDHSLEAQKETNQRLGNLEEGIQTLTTDMDNGFTRLSTEFKSEIGRLDNRLDQTNQRLDQTNQRLDQTNQKLTNLEGEMKEVKGVLKEIKKDFLQEQRETNALLKQLIAKK